jgi:hypothetical protein
MNIPRRASRHRDATATAKKVTVTLESLVEMPQALRPRV